MDEFRAVVVREDGDGVRAGIELVGVDSLPDLPVTVRVAYSTLNYKDGMVMRGLGRIVRAYPHVPGVDLVGQVVSDTRGELAEGSWVIVTGFRMGEATWGGYADRARVRPEWIVALPETLSPRDAMGIGTAGLTAMLALEALERYGVAPKPDGREFLVTGAAGGVGSIATALAAHRGFSVAASTGRPEEEPYLQRLGASAIYQRDELSAPPTRPLEKARWCGAIDAVGGTTLARVLSELDVGGAVASVGLAGGSDFVGSVMPFLLRGAGICGIDSVGASLTARRVAWNALAEELDRDLLHETMIEVGLDEVVALAPEILSGKVRGRVVVRVTGEV
ncbi:MAG: MDR family oxidoreductase [Ferrimicrobium sp.]